MAQTANEVDLSFLKRTKLEGKRRQCQSLCEIILPHLELFFVKFYRDREVGIVTGPGRRVDV